MALQIMCSCKVSYVGMHSGTPFKVFCHLKFNFIDLKSFSVLNFPNSGFPHTDVQILPYQEKP
jgi:hypothetical protein